ncbi:AAEL015414-PA [Aedes aegypti]|uniref:AAEL015414-PA n=1 Tax=Aedes aegypti TaxID=7159 RepID=Q16E57_AEDAE|nr:AAEL015414-PA [Aedes aegypti]
MMEMSFSIALCFVHIIRLEHKSGSGKSWRFTLVSNLIEHRRWMKCWTYWCCDKTPIGRCETSQKL